MIDRGELGASAAVLREKKLKTSNVRMSVCAHTHTQNLVVDVFLKGPTEQPLHSQI